MKKLAAFCLLLGLCHSAAADEANYFLLSYYPGASWNSSLSYEAQPGLQGHHDYVRQMHISDQIVMGGAVASSRHGQLSVMLVRTGSLEQAERLASQDPGVQMRLVRAEVLPWEVNMSSIRVVRRQPMAPVGDPDQTFSIKRVDPESRLNIDD